VVFNLGYAREVLENFFTVYEKLKNFTINVNYIIYIRCRSDRLCGIVVRVPGCRPRGPGFDSRRYQIF
jgi:hypothetical protein